MLHFGLENAELNPPARLPDENCNGRRECQPEAGISTTPTAESANKLQPSDLGNMPFAHACSSEEMASPQMKSTAPNKTHQTATPMDGSRPTVSNNPFRKMD
ncbi:hypothetical protein AACH11_22015 [Ideonella sp. BYS139W]|uniref:Uncharacterized protein n=1 Tax=Pseudaquabacterium rugosum TaxID=2984194 RepID=A0ABU9BFC8_9BURK